MFASDKQDCKATSQFHELHASDAEQLAKETKLLPQEEEEEGDEGYEDEDLWIVFLST